MMRGASILSVLSVRGSYLRCIVRDYVFSSTQAGLKCSLIRSAGRRCRMLQLTIYQTQARHSLDECTDWSARDHRWPDDANPGSILEVSSTWCIQAKGDIHICWAGRRRKRQTGTRRQRPGDTKPRAQTSYLPHWNIALSRQMCKLCPQHCLELVPRAARAGLLL